MSDKTTQPPSDPQAKRIILLLAATVALMMTGVGIIFPIYARRLSELGGGVQTLGAMTVAFMLAQLIFAPIMGSLADRVGRKPIILISLAAFTLANIGYLFAPTTTAIILIRALQGALSSGLYPSSMAMVGDIMPEKERGRWVGILSASYAAGFIFGPLVGGILYDGWGFAAPFVVSAIMASLALAAAAIFVRETLPASARTAVSKSPTRPRFSLRNRDWSWLPRPLTMLGALLLIDFSVVFAFAFVEPQMIFTMYDDLGWSTVQFGILVGAYGLTAAVGQAVAGPLSDRFARFPIIIIGILLNALFYAGLLMFTQFPILVLTAVVAGTGEALLMPSLSAYYLDVASEQHRSRVMGLKESAAAAGGVAGPLLISAVAAALTAQQVYLVALIVTLIAGVFAVLFLRQPRSSARTVPEPAADTSIMR
ncbi:MAG: MFS transporter [Chloroflexi bacterium]|jgi:DHA1 family tetracycline resistance protein-like MFS transporter|nr:MFS transporter [Chloroflexota bacterium]